MVWGRDHDLLLEVLYSFGREFEWHVKDNSVAWYNWTREQILRAGLKSWRWGENNQYWHYRMKECNELEWMKAISLGMGSAESFIDIGANFGAFSVTVAQTFPDRRVIFVEPVSSNCSRLEENIRLNGLTSFVLLQPEVVVNRRLIPGLAQL